MTQLAATKAAMGAALKVALNTLTLPGQKSKKVNTKMRLECALASGTMAVLTCAEVSSGRPPGHYGLYWLLSLQQGPLMKVMTETGLADAKGWSGDAFFAVTSHAIEVPSHREVSPDADFTALAGTIVESMRTFALPMVAAFETDQQAGIDLLLDNTPKRVRNPFTQCVILMHLAGRQDRLAELMARAAETPSLHDFKAAADPYAQIVEPVGDWFETHGI